MVDCHACGEPLEKGKTNCPYCGASRDVQDGPMSSPLSKNRMKTLEEGLHIEATPWEIASSKSEDILEREKNPDDWLLPVTDRSGRLLWFVIGVLAPPLGWLLFFTCIERRPGMAVWAGIGGYMGIFVLFVVSTLVAEHITG